jgi:hypothetical protein
VDTILWFEMAQHLILLTQASQRAWRLGKQGEVRVFYLAYSGTVSHDKLKQLASQGGAAALFSGNAPQGGLAEHVGADQGALAQITQKLARRCVRHEKTDVKSWNNRPRHSNPRCSISEAQSTRHRGHCIDSAPGYLPPYH